MQGLAWVGAERCAALTAHINGLAHGTYHSPSQPPPRWYFPLTCSPTHNERSTSRIERRDRDRPFSQRVS